jgi:Tfp pilus tip-associated adhesin PilY1
MVETLVFYLEATQQHNKILVFDSLEAMMIKPNIKLYPWPACAVLSFNAITQTHAAPGTLANSPLFTTSNVPPNVFFQLDYNKATYSGDVLAKNINQYARGQTTGPWDYNNPTLTSAATLLDLVNYDSSRKIVTRNGSSHVPFRWASLSTAQQNSIGNTTTGPHPSYAKY